MGLRNLLFVALALMSAPALADDADQAGYTGRVIDMHLHASPADTNGPAPNAMCPGMFADTRYTGETPWPVVMTQLLQDPPCDDPIPGPATDAEVMQQTIAQMQKYDVVGVLTSSDEAFAIWSAAAPDRFIRGLSFNVRSSSLSAEEVGAAFDAGTFQVLGEVTNQYAGVLADDPDFAAYWAVAEERAFPVALHLGTGPPGAPAMAPDFRIQSPLAMESVMRKHPGLRAYLMHAGYPFIDDLKAMLYYYPQLYVDTGVLQIATPRAEYYAFLEELVRAGFVDRIMFGSDQMNWPGMIGEGIDAINDAPFLTYEQKKAILHDNAARFLRLELDANGEAIFPPK